MEYNFRAIEKKWQKAWKESGVYGVDNTAAKPKFYVLDMFPYPSGVGLHVGHPLGYIASDIYARYKRLKGFNVLHPMGFDSFGLPAEQYALETGQHPAVTTEKNIETYRQQLDSIGFSFDWSREVRTSDPKYYKWTQWIFLEIFNSWYDKNHDNARRIEDLIKIFEQNGNKENNGQRDTQKHFSADEWNSFSGEKKQEILMDYRLAYSAYGEVNWCEALGTVLANDEVVNGVSERGGHPVVKRKMRQWYMRITDYAERLITGLDTVDFSDSMKEMQRNWIGKSEGAEIEFSIATKSLTPNPSPEGEGGGTSIKTSNSKIRPQLKDLSRENRKEETLAEDTLWQKLRNNKLGSKVRRQHVIDNFIIDFAFLNEKLLIEIDGGYHNDTEQKKYDDLRTEFLEELGYRILRFNTEEVERKISNVIDRIKIELGASPLSLGRGAGGEALPHVPLKLKVYTTRPDTIFGVDFMVLAPEHELVDKITSNEQRQSVDEYLTYVKSRSDRERMAEVKQITGCFTGAYALNPFDGRKIPIWIAEYVLAGYGTGAIMAVPCGDQRDFDFANHFNIPITNIIGDYFNGQEANPTKEATLINSGFLNGIKMKDAIDIVLKKIEEEEIGQRKVNYKMRDAGFSRQRYWGEPFPIVYHNRVAYPLHEEDLPVELPHVENYKPGPEGEGPLANILDWVNMDNGETELQSDLTPGPSPGERGEENAGYVTSDAATWKTLKPFARENRKNKTQSENLLWQNIRNRNVADAKFRRQHAIGRFIVDFVCLEKNLVIEIDGEYHSDAEQKKYDDLRTEYLKENGFNEIRFSNEEVSSNISEVLATIKRTLKESSPLPRRGVRGEVYKRETNTMPGYAGSSWYFLRYMDPHNDNEFASRQATDYWNQVDVYIGGTEHAVGHLLYSRMWTKVLFDLGFIGFDEPYKKLVNQGMIQGKSSLAYRFTFSAVHYEDGRIMVNDNFGFDSILISKDVYKNMLNENGALKSDYLTFFENFFDAYYIRQTAAIADPSIHKIHIPIQFVDHNDILDTGRLSMEWRGYGKMNFITGDSNKFICESEIEKMSKSKLNTVDPSELVNKYGADTFRMYEMFLGPVEQSKPWDTKGIEGVHRFLKKLWRLFNDEVKGPIWTSWAPSPSERAGGEATDAELKVLHKTIKKIDEDTERFSYNTAVSAFMVCVNELTDLKCHKKEILEPLLILLAPYAPHIAEELYHALGNNTTIIDAVYPKLKAKYLIESEKEYPVSINGKLRTTITISLDATQDEVEKIALGNEVIQKWIEGKPPKKIIFVKNKMVNVVV